MKAWHYVSCVDTDREPGQQFVGACIIEADSVEGIRQRVGMLGPWKSVELDRAHHVTGGVLDNGASFTRTCLFGDGHHVEVVFAALTKVPAEFVTDAWLSRAELDDMDAAHAATEASS